MKTLRLIALLLVFSAPALAQFNLPGGGIAGTGIGPFESHGSTNTSSGNSGGGNNRSDNDEPRHAKPELTPEERQAIRDNQEYSALLREKSSAKTAAKWAAFAKRTNWGVAWYAYAETLVDIGQSDDALPTFMWLKDHCHQNDSLDLCHKAADAALDITNSQGVALYNQGDYNSAIAHWQQQAKDFLDDPVAYYNIAVTYEKQGQIDNAFEAARQSTARTGFVNDPFRDKALALYYNQWENVQYNKAAQILQSQITPDYEQAKLYLRQATRYDNITGNPSYNARAVLAAIEHIQGDDQAALIDCTTVLAQHPGDESCSQTIAVISNK
jgi:tetratricopeptide (TPR) repeat protein